MTYQPGTRSLSVFVDGVNQYGPGASYAYQETSSTVVTFTTGLHVGAEVKFTTSAINTSSYGDAQQVSYTPPFTGSVPTNVELKLAQTVSVKDFGAVGNGVADDTVAIQAALNSGAGTVYFPEGTYPVSTALTVPSNITLTGDGVGNTKLTVVGTGTNNIFYALNRQNIKISDIWFYGNSQASASGDGLAIFFYQNGSATEIGGNFRVENCRFENFKGDYWVYVVNDNTTYNISNIYVNNNSFKSFPGNARNGATTAVPSTCISVQGSTAGAEVTDVFVTNNSAD
jgi:polygalacturonase